MIVGRDGRIVFVATDDITNCGVFSVCEFIAFNIINSDSERNELCQRVHPQVAQH